MNLLRPGTACATIALVVGFGGAQNGPADIVISGEKGYALITPEVVSQAIVTDFKWSSDGKHLLYIKMESPSGKDLKAFLSSGQRPPSMSMSAMIWTPATKKQTTIRKLTGPVVDIDAHWLRGTSTALVSVLGPPSREGPEGRAELIRADALTGTTHVLQSADRYVPNGYRIHTAPHASNAVVFDHRDNEQGSLEPIVFEVGRTGLPSQAFTLPHMAGFMGWNEQGLPCFEVWGRPSTEGKPSRTFRVLDFANGRIIDQPTRPKVPEPKEGPADPIRLEIDANVASSPETTRQSRNLWLLSAKKSRRNFAFVAADVSLSQLSPALDYVAYTTQAVLMVRPIVEAKASDFEAALDAAERAVLLSNAKQLATAAMMYAESYNDRIPGATEDIKALLMPFIKNDAIFEGFVWTFSGGNHLSIPNPAETELGHIPGKGGRAVFYADGHAKWVKD